MTTSVIVPTFARPEDLSRCLTALCNQKVKAAQVIVVCRSSDTASREVIGSFRGTLPTLEEQLVSKPGQVASLNKGLQAVSADIVAITDDDAAPRTDWIEKITDHFEKDPSLSGLGGRDWQWYGGKMNDGERTTVGKVQWFGRTIGNHHLGCGPPREVDIVKGVNMSFRTSSIRDIKFDSRLRGRGAEIHNDLGISLAVRSKGMKLVYDPAVAVDHYPAKRADGDVNHRGGFHAPSLTDSVHNETLVLLDYLPPVRRVTFILWTVLFGTWENPGVVGVLRLLIARYPNILPRWHAAMRGRYYGWRSYKSERRKPATGSIAEIRPTSGM